MFSVLFNFLFQIDSFLSGLLYPYCINNQPQYYGSLLVFSSVAFSIISASTSMANEGYHKILVNAKERKLSAMIALYVMEHSGRILFISFLFLLSVLINMVYFFSNHLLFGKISFLIAFSATALLVVFFIYIYIKKKILVIKSRIIIFIHKIKKKLKSGLEKF